MRTCRECGEGFKSRQYNAEFCGGPCRKAFNNRRMQRGAAVYDLLMIGKFDPQSVERWKLDGRLDALVETFHKDDEANGRKRSWKRPDEVHYDTALVVR